MPTDSRHHSHTGGAAVYKRLMLMLILSAIAMYFLMYAMVNELGNVYMNVNQLYMVLLMVAPMAVIEVKVMRGMYPNARLNTAITIGSAVLLLGSWLAIREQAVVGDTQFLRSMIPHHSGAILMCERADLSRPDLQELCRSIIESQRSEISQMTVMLEPSAH
jgi:uncharacterized protein (DUF305 family)